MHTGDTVPLVGRGTSMSEALLIMTAKSFGCVGVVDGAGELAGIITDGDLRRHMRNGLLERRAEDVMTRSPRTVPSDMLAAAALGMMNDRKITALFVVDNAKPVGIVHIHDLLRAGFG
jgi:arabinose-5-phosphate isomerase